MEFEECFAEKQYHVRTSVKSFEQYNFNIDMH